MALFWGFFLLFWLQVTCKKKYIYINPQFFPPSVFFPSAQTSPLPPGFVGNQPSKSHGEKPPLQPFPQLLRSSALGSQTSPGPVSPEPILELVSWHQKGGFVFFFAFSPRVLLPNGFKSTRGAAALPDAGARAGQNPVGVFAGTCGWRRRELLQTPKFHSLKKNNQQPNPKRNQEMFPHLIFPPPPPHEKK